MDTINPDIMHNRIVAHSSSCKFKRKFELQNVCKDFKFVNINIKTLPFIYGLNLEQYDVDVILNKLNFHLKIVCPIEVSVGVRREKNVFEIRVEQLQFFERAFIECERDEMCWCRWCLCFCFDNLN